MGVVGSGNGGGNGNVMWRGDYEGTPRAVCVGMRGEGTVRGRATGMRAEGNSEKVEAVSTPFPTLLYFSLSFLFFLLFFWGGIRGKESEGKKMSTP